MSNEERAELLFKRLTALPDHLCRATYAGLFGMMQDRFNNIDLDNLEQNIKRSEDIIAGRKEESNG